MTVCPTTQHIQTQRRDFLKSIGQSAAALMFLDVAGCALRAAQRDGTARRNIVFVLSDDHRYDFMSFMKIC